MSTRDLVLAALFTAIIIVLGLIPPVPLAFLPVPITAQSMGVMLAGCIIGAKRGALAYVFLVILVAVGLPVLSGGRGGLAVLTGPTAGYILGWIVGSFVTGQIAQQFVREGSRHCCKSAASCWQLGRRHRRCLCHRHALADIGHRHSVQQSGCGFRCLPAGRRSEGCDCSAGRPRRPRRLSTPAAPGLTFLNRGSDRASHEALLKAVPVHRFAGRRHSR